MSFLIRNFLIKKYRNGDKKGDYEEFLKNDFTTPEDIVITKEGIIQNDSGEMIQFKNISEVINRIQKSKLFMLKKMYQPTSIKMVIKISFLFLKITTI